jgi:hypothetical protein
LTRYGKLSDTDDNLLTLDGKQVAPTVQGNNGLDFVKIFRVGQSDITLVQDDGGTACPAQYYFITINEKGTTSSPSFGTCSDLIKVRQDGDAILVTMAGFQGPLEPPAKQAMAANQTHSFAFVNGQLLADGKAVNSAIAQPRHDAVAPVPSPTVSHDVHLDQPLREQTITVPGPVGQADSKVRCVFYKEFMIREVHAANDIGSASISVVPATAPEPAVCSAERATQEKNLTGHEGKEFVGAAGPLLAANLARWSQWSYGIFNL